MRKRRCGLDRPGGWAFLLLKYRLPDLTYEGLATSADAIYVLHCFQKKTGKTSKADVELAAKRFRELLKELGQ